MTDRVDRAPEIWAEFNLGLEVKHNFSSHFFMAHSPADYMEGDQKEYVCVKFMSEGYR